MEMANREGESKVVHIGSAKCRLRIAFAWGVPGLLKLDSLVAACHPFLLVGSHDVVRGSRAILGGSYGTVCSATVRMKD